MERAVKRGEAVTAKHRAHLLSSIPRAGSGNQVFLLDVHTEGLPHYFDEGIRTVHLYSKPVILDIAATLGGVDYVLACTDAGRAKWVESLANELGVPVAFVFKRRLEGGRTEVSALSAHVRGKRVILYDDMIRTGGSLMGAARAYLEAGAKEIAAVATHGLFPGDALKRLATSGLFVQIVCTDSHPRALELAGDFLKVETISGVLADHLSPRW
jgi:ribose-phosphate pyrophosphokinase